MSLESDIVKLNTVFIDTAPFIYYIEAHPLYGTATKTIFDMFLTGKLIAFSSVISLAEVLPKPVEERKERLAGRFSEFLRDSSVITMTDINQDIAERAGRLRGKYPSLRALDALQLSASIETGADAFVTNDRKLRQVREVKLLLLSDYVKAL
ncbi:MAG: PIN domain-containing protein [Nitrospirae bacterium]|nr:PIN domain-containing protein [Nitrospirota bacterium]